MMVEIRQRVVVSSLHEYGLCASFSKHRIYQMITGKTLSL
jgi:hypothetical protein